MRRAAALAVAVAAGLGGCGGGGAEQRGAAGGARYETGRGDGPLVWVEKPRLYIASGASERVLQGRVRNGSPRPVTIRAKEVRALAAAGGRVPASVHFGAGFTKPLYPQDRGVDIPEFDQRRLGRIVTLRPGEEAPLTVAWDLDDGPAPGRIRYRAGALAFGTPILVTQETVREMHRQRSSAR